MGLLKDFYELSESYQTVMDMLYEEDMDPQTVKDTLEGISGESEAKAESLAKIIRMLQAQAELSKAEAQRLSDRAQSFSNRADFMKSVLFENMKAMNIRKFKTPLFTISIVKNGGKEPLVITGSIEDIPGKYLIPQEPKLNNDAIRELLKKKAVDWAHLEPRGEHLGIR